MIKSIKVAVGVLINNHKKVLITQRSLDDIHPGKWEFPGGKLEVNESIEQALVREIQEELSLVVHDFSFIGKVNHQYPDKRVELFVFYVDKFEGQFECQVKQVDYRWVSFDELHKFSWLEANKKIIILLKSYLN